MRFENENLPQREYKIGELPEDALKGIDTKKFIIADDGQSYTLYFGTKNEERHFLIGTNRQIPTDHIPGGGWFYVSPGRFLRLSGNSYEYGGVPVEILSEFVEQLKQSLGVENIILEPEVEPKDRERFGLPPKQE